MSDAPAAPVLENGVPPVGQDSTTSTVAPGFKVFIGNLAYSTTDDGLKDFFVPVEGDIISAQVIQRRTRNGTRSAGYGFVALTTIEAAQTAVEALNKTVLDDRTVIVEIAKPAEEKSNEPRAPRRYGSSRPPWARGRRGPKSVPGEVTDAEANGEITDKAETAPGTAPATEDAEKPKKKKKKTQRRNKPKPAEGETFAPAADAPETDRAEDAPKPRYRGHRARRPSRPAGEDPVGEPSKSVLFVANLGFNIDDDGLAALFTDAGLKVVSARIVHRRWKPRRSKGYGFVDVGDEEEQKKAIDALQGKEFGGRAIAVKIAVNAPHEDNTAKDTADDNTPEANRRQMELEAREEGLQTSLIQKAQEEAEETGKQNKALAIMIKMGFKPGQSLGESHEESSSSTSIDGGFKSTRTIEMSEDTRGCDDEAETSTTQPDPRPLGFAAYKHRVEPVPIKEWAGKTGIGGVKRPPSPTALERVAKIARQSEALSADEFRDRARKEYEDRRAEGKLRHARATCVNLDTKADIKFNRFWVDPENPESFPPGLLESLEELWSSSSLLVPASGSSGTTKSGQGGPDAGAADRLKAKMQADALQPLNAGPVGGEDDERPLRMGTGVDPEGKDHAETVAAPQRLEQVLEYLRNTYHYCFWCGTQYLSVEELEADCPGVTEEDHD
ncbi:hypothetical protein BJ322DRAFT_1101710 [Thelephora terrestris]|uniref:RNA-binding domain-containing protein n=1 Tax=Thelephora terrestris TaxID=56493 RepID=A0A9P6H4T9_9AGAM|nr:hypothetical protein BJ322DRAFT_1101710 [Thelephora terrestris]